MAFVIDRDFTKFAQGDRALQKLGVRHQANLHKNAGQFNPMFLTRGSVFEVQAIDLLPIA